jgi:hypothetical protein
MYVRLRTRWFEDDVGRPVYLCLILAIRVFSFHAKEVLNVGQAFVCQRMRMARLAENLAALRSHHIMARNATETLAKQHVDQR